MKRILCLAAVTSVLCVPLFWRITAVKLSDNIPHMRIIQRSAAGERAWPPHFLYHRLVHWAAFGSTDRAALKSATVFVLTCLVVWKALFSYSVVDREIHSGTVSFAVAAALIFAAPIVNWWNFPHVYFGQISPTIWHSPTAILSAPLAAWLFYSVCGSLQTLSVNRLALVSLLLALNALAKPNYLLAFVPVTAAVYFFHFWKTRQGLAKSFIYLALLFLPVVGVLVRMYLGKYAGADPSASGIEWAPFRVWETRSTSIAGSLAVSAAFPAVFTALYWKETLADKRIHYAWAVLILAVFLFALFAETGRQAEHGNFAWGHHVSMFVLFLVCAASFFKQKAREVRYSAVLTFFGLHVATGIFVYVRQLMGMGYQ
ncbi:MAG: hypothetical protein ACREH5_04320 [Candidatus Omnitrophota bacterium]